MPQVIAVAAYYVASYFGASSIVAAAVALVVGTVVSNHEARKAQRKARDAYNASLSDRLVMTATSNGARSVVLGRARNVDGVLFKGTWGAKSENYTLVIALAGHEIDGIDQVYVADQPVTIDENFAVLDAPYARTVYRTTSETHIVSGGSISLSRSPHQVLSVGKGVENDRQSTLQFKWSSGPTIAQISGVDGAAVEDGTSVGVTYTYAFIEAIMHVYPYLGAPGQDISAALALRFPGLVNASHKFEGIALLIVDMAYSEDAFPTGVPAITALIRGAKVYDPRDVAQDPDDSTSWKWSENPSLCSRHVALHPNIGGCAPDEIDEASFIVAANACDVSHTYTDTAGVSATRPLYTCGYVAKLDASPEAHLGELVESMAGKSGWSSGTLRVRAGVYTAPVATITDSWLSSAAGQRNIVPQLGLQDTVNTYNPTIADAAQNYVPATLPAVTSSAFLAEDGVELPQDIELTAVTFAPQAQHICGVLMRDLRAGMTVTWPCNMRAWQLELFDVVWVVSDRYGWPASSPKAFEVLGWQHAIDSGIKLTLKQTDASIFQPDSAFTANDPKNNTAYPLPWQVDRLTGLVALNTLAYQGDNSIINLVEVRWGEVNNQSVLASGSIEVQYTRDVAGVPADDADWPSVVVRGNAGMANLVGLAVGEVYLIRARAMNGSGVRGVWSDVILHTVLGKDALPSGVTGLDADDDAIRWTAVPDLDVVVGGGYELRWQPGVSTEWESAQPLHTGILTSSPYRWTIRPSGAITVLAKAVDSSGNRSASAAAVFITLTGTSVRNVVETHDFAPTWSGAISLGEIDSGSIKGSITSEFYREDARLFYADDTSEFYGPDIYSGINYVTDWWPPSSGQQGDGVLVQYTLTDGLGITVEYQVDNGLFYGPDAGSFYGSDTDEFYTAASLDWLPWPGRVSLVPGAVYRWRFACASGAARPDLSAFTAYLDAPDVEENLGVTAISSGGTRLTLSKAFRTILTVSPTLQAGSTAVAFEMADMNPTLGPLVRALDSTRTAVNGSASFLVKGF